MGFELAEMLSLWEAYDVAVIVAGLSVLALALFLHRFETYPISFPIVLLAFGYTAFALPLGLVPAKPRQHAEWAVHLTEMAVIISLMGVGLKIDRRPNWRTWSPTWRLLGICMPLTIAGIALLGWWIVGLMPAAAVLLGAAFAPTDPVLASDVQVDEPNADAEDEIDAPRTGLRNEVDPTSKEDELRFTLTSEAGLNDALAFPFTYLALHMLTQGNGPANWLGQWLLVDVAYRLVVGVAAGIVLGLGLSRILFRLPLNSDPEKMKAGVGAFAGTLLLYGITECIGGYGFLAVFIGAVTIRQSDPEHRAHRSLYTFIEQLEQLLMTGTLIALGGAIAGGLLSALTWREVVLSSLMVLVVRPLTGWISLLGERRLSGLDRLIVSFFGIRGIGCLYYLAFGLNEAAFAEADQLWGIGGLTVVLSVCIHGVAASPVIQFRDRRAERPAH